MHVHFPHSSLYNSLENIMTISCLNCILVKTGTKMHADAIEMGIKSF